MTTKSLSSVPGSFFYSIKEWSEQSIGNYNQLIGITFVFCILSIIFLLYFCLKIGRSDERTLLINLKAAYVMLIAIILCDIIFPREYLVNQFFMLKYGIACFASGIYLALKYRSEVK